MKKAIVILTVIVLLALVIAPVVASALTEGIDHDSPVFSRRPPRERQASADSPVLIARGGCRQP